ncbi:MAG: PQQ-binding-like beta-propeller repeat protein [Phycisphaerae bacterium]
MSGGLCVHLDCADGNLASGLAVCGRFVVHALAATDTIARNARLQAQSRNLHGLVSVEQGSPSRLPYADNMVDLVVVDDFSRGMADGLSVPEVIRVLEPGGVAYLEQPAEDGRASLDEGTLRAALAKAGTGNFDIVKHSGLWARLRKPRPREMDEWTHWLHGPGGANLSADSLVGPPTRLQWIDGPYWPLGDTRAAVFAGGRGFAVFPKGQAGRKALWSLVARDAYNGLRLWQREIETGGQQFDPRLLVASGQLVFTVLKDGGPAVALDAASGEVAKTYDVGVSPRVILCVDGCLILAADSQIRSVNVQTGALKWKAVAPGKTAFRYRSPLNYSQYPHVLVGGGQLFVLVDGSDQPPHSLVCYDLASGQERWKRKQSGELLRYYEDVVVFVSQPEPFAFGKKILGTIHAVASQDGRDLWECPGVLGVHADANAFCAGGLLWVNKDGKGIVGLDPATGQERKSLKGVVTGHCGFVRTTDRYFIGVYDSLIDCRTGARTGQFAFKNTCFLGNIPANGLLYNMPVYCGCMPYLRGTMAFSSAAAPAQSQPAASAAAEEALTKGPAYGEVTQPAEGQMAQEWNTYRHDAQRSGSTPEAISRDLAVLWSTAVDSQERTPFGRSITSPVAAEGMVFAAMPDGQAVCALDASTGKVRWRHLVGGRVEVPPTIHRGLCLFGANDGYVYCLRAADGELVWRFRAAPEERRIMVGGRLESPWPVPGVTVEGGLACFAAGRHSGMDGGIFIHGLDPSSGRLAWTRRVTSKDADTSIKREHRDWTDFLHANDLLVACGKSLVMGRLAVEPSSGDLSISGKDERYLSSGQARSGRGLVPFGFLTDRADVALRYPTHYMGMRYQLTLWSYAGTDGLLLAFDRDRVFAVKGMKPRPTGQADQDWELSAVRPSATTTAAREQAALWTVPVTRGAVRALLPAGQVLLTAGPADKTRADDGVLGFYSKDDGSKLGEVNLPDAPVFDGMAASGGRVYVATQRGRIICLGPK